MLTRAPRQLYMLQSELANALVDLRKVRFGLSLNRVYRFVYRPFGSTLAPSWVASSWGWRSTAPTNRLKLKRKTSPNECERSLNER